MRYIKHLNISSCVCIKCGNKFPIPRPKRSRKKGHIKSIYCPFCQELTYHYEVRAQDYDVCGGVNIGERN